MSTGFSLFIVISSIGTLLWVVLFIFFNWRTDGREKTGHTFDGIEDVVVSSWENAATVLDGATGTLVWKTTVGTTNGGDVWTARGIDDLNGDGFADVIAGSFDQHVYALNGLNGDVFWAYAGPSLPTHHGTTPE